MVDGAHSPTDAKNLCNFIENLYNKEKKDIYINLEDEIINNTLISKKL